MGVPKKRMILDFLNSRFNLNALQCILYFVVGYIMAEYLNLVQFIITFVAIFSIQFITRIKAVADGMMFRQLIQDYGMEVNEIVKRIREQADIDRKNDNIN